MFRTPMACVQSPEQDHSLRNSVVLDGDGAEVPLMHSVSFYRRQKPQVGISHTNCLDSTQNRTYRSSVVKLQFGRKPASLASCISSVSGNPSAPSLPFRRCR